MKRSTVLLDTSFLIRLLHDKDPLQNNAEGYFLDEEITLKVSTISIAEYCVREKIDELPLEKIKIIPFNLDHAKRTGEFAKVMFEENKIAKEKLSPRAIIPNDAKLFAQADLDPSIAYFVTSDSRSEGTFSILKKRVDPKFKIIDMAKPYNETFGVLPFFKYTHFH